MRVKTYIDHEDDFYAIMGPYFANRKYAQEMGGWQFYTKDKAVWFLGFEGETLIGFCSAIFEKTHIYFDNFYVFKQYRGKGYSNQLSEARMGYCRKLNTEIRVISDNPIQHKKYINDGFIQCGKRGRYDKFKWRPDQNTDLSAVGIFKTKSLEP